MMHTTEHWFSGLISRQNGKLRFDFYLPEYNLCIEYDGKQHFYPVNYYGDQEGLNIRQENDEIKNAYCEFNHIKLIRIPYTVTDEKISKIINENIQESRNDHSLGSNDQTYADNSYSLMS